MRWLVGRPLVGHLVGSALAVVSLVAVMRLVWHATYVGPLSDLADETAELIAAPMLPIGLAAGAFFIAEYSRRGTWGEREREWRQGGTTTVSIDRAVPIRWLLLWVCVSAALAAAVLIPPLMDAPTTLTEEADFAILVALYAGTAGAVGGAVVASIVKKLATRRRRRTPEQPSAAWVWFAGRWRGESWGMAVAGAALGVMPMAAAFGGAWLVVTGALAAAFSLLSTLAVWGAVRAGVDYSQTESFS